MRYLLILSTLAVLTLGVLAVPHLSRQVLGGRDAVTPTPTQATLTREQAIRVARIMAEAYGEENPVLLDATVAPLQEQLRKVDPKGPLDGPSTNAPMWMVRMRGTFRPPRGLTAVEPERGVMHVVIDPVSGQMLGSGYRADKRPAKEPDPSTREYATGLAARLLGLREEPEPKLVYARRTTYREALTSVRRDPDEFLGRPGSPPVDHPVWVVVFTGTFDRIPDEVPPQPRVGFAITDAVTGKEVVSGFGEGYDILTPGPAIKTDPP